MIRVADYIVKRLEEYGIKHIFMISGGGAMHLNDAIGKSQKIKYICNHHEQASAIGAEGYSRVSGKLSVVNVTSGPGGTNTLTGVIGQWLDSVPVLYISGQVKLETTVSYYENIGLRQLGDQEINIVDIVKSVTKFAYMLKDAAEIKKILDKAIYIATHGRPGPVWIDVPLNIQAAMIDENILENYDGKEYRKNLCNEKLESKVRQVIELLKSSKRPVFVAGRGIRISGEEKAFLEIVEKLGIPVVTTFNNVDIIPTDHPQFIGRMGTIGNRAGNFAVQNSDVYLSVGSRNNIRQISYNWKNVAREAKKIVVDIDSAELQKQTFVPDIAIQADANDFLEEFLKQIKDVNLPDFSDWLNWCQKRKSKYPVVLPEYKTVKEQVQPYYFVETLTKNMKDGDIIVAGNGTACVALFQAGIVKDQQRFIWNSGCASMGYDLPAAIGASIANENKPVICLAGDGSLMMNLQELATVKHYNLPIKLFVLNNCGYISIKQTQENFFEKRLVACDSSCGVGFPEFINVAKSFGLPVFVIDNQENMEQKIKDILAMKFPVVCEVMLQPDYKFSPKLSSEKKADGRMISKPLEDMWPFLDREEFAGNMIVKKLEE